MSRFKLVVNTDDDATQVGNLLSPTLSVNAGDAWALNRAWSSYFAAVADGAKNTSTFYADTMASATGTITVASTGPTNGQTMTIANQTLTAETSGAVPASGQFNINASPTVVAAGIALAINSVPALVGIVSATAALGVVTVTATVGNVGNGIQLSAGNLSNVTVVAFSGGAESNRATVSSNK